MKSYLVHYMNKYPGGRVDLYQNDLVAYCKGGHKRVHMERDSIGRWVDVSEQRACLDRHDLAPIPKQTRVWKLYADGTVGPSEEAAERSKYAEAYAAIPLCGPGRVPSEYDLKQAGISGVPELQSAPVMQIPDAFANATPVESLIPQPDVLQPQPEPAVVSAPSSQS